MDDVSSAKAAGWVLDRAWEFNHSPHLNEKIHAEWKYDINKDGWVLTLCAPGAKEHYDAVAKAEAPIPQAPPEEIPF